ncbi:phenylacetate--CoA ligase family protein [Enterovirga aerilata]|uniref:AMP-binding protein n=1 Tax=Enterovirga aerilata TaxID=2730920 RepID=A0A849I5J3_9HYPH|nr:AMP-binding protein [Enterovirga sp. DB1703]NNM71605.1 AMP-binding protein [Enterovirga sp. DB1703]
MSAALDQTGSAGHWSPVESWSRDELESYQLERLREQLGRLARSPGHYGDLFGRMGFEPEEIRELSDITALPFTHKADYVASVAAAPPHGRFVSVPMSEVRRIHFSSGTTAKPTPQFWTQRDLDRWADLYARTAHAQGVEPGDVFQCLFTYTWFVGGLGATLGYQRAGATCIPAGSQDTARQISTIFEYGTTVLCGTPSFIVHLGEEIEKRGLSPATSKVRAIMVGGEPGASVPATRKRIQDLWDARCYDFYGCLEFQPIAGECEAQSGPHIAEDFVCAEIVDPDTKAPVPDGTPGVLVVTHLDKQAGPLVRWWTGDIVVRDRSRCGCGRTHARLVGGVHGRADDMLIVRGVNVFPSAVEDVVRAIPGLGDEYQIVVDRSVRDDATGFLKGIRLRVEGSDPALPARLAEAIKQRLSIRAEIELLPPGSLERTTHKAKRLVRADD